MSILVDTDVLSAFAKIKALDLLNRLFPNDGIVIPSGVYEELVYIKERGYGFVEDIFIFVQSTSMTEDETLKYHSFLTSTGLGKGELQCISVCSSRALPFITNDRKAKNFAREQGVKVWDIPDILKALWISGIKSKEEVAAMMDMMEQKDMMVIKDKKRILT